MAVRCHVCGQTVRRRIDVPICGDAESTVPVCSKRCRDEYLGGFVETREGRTYRFLHPPAGPGNVVAAVWIAYAAVRLLGPLLDRWIAIPLLPQHRGATFVTAGAVALIIAYGLFRRIRYARALSGALAAAGFVFALGAYLRSDDLAWAIEAGAFYPAVALLSIGDPRPARVVVALALFGAYPASLIVTALTTRMEKISAVERVAAESYAERAVLHPSAGLGLSVPRGWYILRPESRLLPQGDYLFRAVQPEDGTRASLSRVADCDAQDLTQIRRILDEMERGGARVEVVGSGVPSIVRSAFGAGHAIYVVEHGPEPTLWYAAVLPWADDRCIEIRCGGPDSMRSAIRRDCPLIALRGSGPH